MNENEIQEKIKLSVENGIQDPDELLELLSNLSPTRVKWFRRGCENIDFIKLNIKKFMELEGIENVVDESLIEELYSKNNSVVRSVDFKILDPKYIETLGKEKINLISCYPQIQTQVLILKYKELGIFSKCLESYTENMETEEWTTLATPVLYNMILGGYGELLKGIELEELTDEDIKK